MEVASLHIISKGAETLTTVVMVEEMMLVVVTVIVMLMEVIAVGVFFILEFERKSVLQWYFQYNYVSSTSTSSTSSR